MGGYKTGGGGLQVKFYPYKRVGGAGEKVLAMLKGGGGGGGGHNKCWSSFYAVA